MHTVEFSVFTKPWMLDIPALGKRISALGFDGIELPVRHGYPVNPDNLATALPEAVRILADFGLKIMSVASSIDASTIAACSESGVPLIRICVSIRRDETYDEGVARVRRDFDAALPHLEQYDVAIGVQNHYGRDVCNAMGLRNLLLPYESKSIGIVWDAAHNTLQGEEPELALDIVWDKLRIVNLKNAFWQRSNGLEAEVADWRVHWTTGRHGLASWPRVAASLIERSYTGPICLTAEYDQNDTVDSLIAQDIAFARSLFNQS